MTSNCAKVPRTRAGHYSGGQPKRSLSVGYLGDGFGSRGFRRPKSSSFVTLTSSVDKADIRPESSSTRISRVDALSFPLPLQVEITSGFLVGGVCETKAVGRCIWQRSSGLGSHR